MTLRAGATTLTAFALDDGHFLFDGVPAGEFFVSAIAGDAASDVVGPFALEPGGAVEGLVLTLAPAATLEGTVVDTLGHAPIAGAWVTAPSGRARTGADGHFTVRGATGQVWVEATAPGYLSRIEWVAVEKGRAAGRFELALTPVSRLSGTVLEGGRTVAGASVWAEIAVGARRGERSAMVLTDKDGHFELECTSGVLVPMAATSRGARIRGKELRLGLGEKRTNLLLEAADAAPVDATVTRDGQPLSGASVAVLDSGSEELVASAVTGPLGRFVVPALQAGRYVVQVGLGSFRALAGPFEQTGSGATWTIALKGGAVLEGEVRPAIAGAQVRWRSGDWTGPPATTTTDADGRFRFEGVPAGPALGRRGGAGGRGHGARPGRGARRAHALQGGGVGAGLRRWRRAGERRGAHGAEPHHRRGAAAAPHRAGRAVALRGAAGAVGARRRGARARPQPASAGRAGAGRAAGRAVPGGEQSRCTG